MPIMHQAPRRHPHRTAPAPPRWRTAQRVHYGPDRHRGGL